MISKLIKSIKFKIESRKVIKKFKNNIENGHYDETDAWSSFIYTITTKELDSLNEIQRKAVLCFWYDAEVNSSGHYGFFDIYDNLDFNELYYALKDITNKEISDNFKSALKEKKNNYDEEDNNYYSFNPSLTDYLEKYVENNKNEILKNEKFIYEPKTIEDLNYNTKQLFDKIIKDNKIKGTIKLNNERIDYITWNITGDYFIEISFDYHNGYIGIYKKNEKEKINLTHWHPEFDEIYNDFLELNNKDNIIVVTVKRMSGGYDIFNKNGFNKEKYKNNFFHKYYIIGDNYE